MNDHLPTQNALTGRFEPIEIGVASSRLSKAVFLTLFAVLVFGAVVFGGVDQVSWVIFSFLAAAIAIMWLAAAWFGRALLVNRDVLLLPLIGLLVIGVIQLVPLFAPSVADGVLADPARSPISLDPYATRLFLIRLWVYMVFFAAALTFVNTGPRLKKVVYFVIVFGAVMAFFAILQRLANPESIYGMRPTPQAIPFGSFVNQHHFAAFMEMAGGVTFGLLFGGGLRREKRVLLATAAIVMGASAVMTSSRGGLLSFIAMLVFVLTVSFLTSPAKHGTHSSNRRPQHTVAMIAAGTAIVVIIVGTPLFLGENNSVIRALGLSGMDDLTNGRAHFWPIAVRVFLDHPLFGAGFDAFGVAFTRYDTWPGIFRVEQAHNDYLQILADAGVAGFACIAAFIYLLFRKGLKTIADSTDHFRWSAAIGALGGCFGILIHSFFDFPLRTPSNAFFFLTLVTIAVVAVKHPRRSTHLDD